MTVHLNHSLLRLRRAEVKHYLLFGNSAADRVASPFGLYWSGTGPDFDQEALDEFDDLKPKAADKLKLRPLENPCQKPREITIYLGGTGKEPASLIIYNESLTFPIGPVHQQQRWGGQSWHV